MEKKPEKNPFRVLDTFAGAGGFSLGFEMAGASVVGAIETDAWACDTYRANNPQAIVVQKDIADVTDEELLEKFGKVAPNVILGGPPCQGFSICNKKNGDPKDPRNSLFEEFVRVGRVLKPDVMIMENVPNLIKAKTQEGDLVVDIIVNELENLGFFVEHKILQAVDYGVPQIRRRLFVIASKVDLEGFFPAPTHTNEAEPDLLSQSLKKCPTLWDAISDLPRLEAREGAEVAEYIAPPENFFQKAMRKGSKQVCNHKAMNHTKRLVERFASMSWGDSSSDVPAHLRPRKRNSTEFSDKTYDQNNRRMHPMKPCHTIAASFYANFVHPYQDRNFTAREGARIQSFPDTYIFKGKPTVVSRKLLQKEGRFDESYLCQYNQIGNAVPPILAKHVAKNLFKKLEDARSRKQSKTERRAQNKVSECSV